MTTLTPSSERNKCFGGGGLAAKSCPTLVTPWTIPRQALLSMEFPRQQYYSGYSFLLQGIFQPHYQIQVSHISGRHLTLWATREAIGLSHETKGKFSVLIWLMHLHDSWQVSIQVPLTNIYGKGWRERGSGSSCLLFMGKYPQCVSQRNWFGKMTAALQFSVNHFMGLPCWSSGFRLQTSNAGGMCSIPGQGIKIPHVVQHSQVINK